jgi:hypothetical protein
VVSPRSKLTRPIKKPKATWVEPTFYTDVEYRDITPTVGSGQALSKAFREEQDDRDDIWSTNEALGKPEREPTLAVRLGLPEP